MRRDARYVQIYEALQHQIDTLAPNTTLPSENDLATRFGVSRVTIRRALGLLERSGVLCRHPGRGTTVNPPKITRCLSPMKQFVEDFERQGIKFEIRILDYTSKFTPPRFVLDGLSLVPGSLVGFLSFDYVVETQVVCYCRHYFPPELAEKFDPGMVLRQPVVDILRKMSSARIRASKWTTEIISAPRDIAEPLRIAPGALVLVNTGTDYLTNGKAIQVAVNCYRIDRVKFRFEVNYGESGRPRTPESCR